MTHKHRDSFRLGSSVSDQLKTKIDTNLPYLNPTLKTQSCAFTAVQMLNIKPHLSQEEVLMKGVRLKPHILQGINFPT